MAGMTALDDAATDDALPRWDLTPLFPTVDGPEVAAAEAALADASTTRRRCTTATTCGAPARPPRPRRRATARLVDRRAAFDEVLAATNDVLERFARLEAFAYGHVSTDSGDEAAQALLSRLTTVEARIAVLRSRFDAWVGTLDLDDARSPPARRPPPTPGRCARPPDGRPTRCPSPRSRWLPSWASPARRPGAGCTRT